MAGIFYDRASATSAFAGMGRVAPSPPAGIVESFDAAFNATLWADVPTQLQRHMEEAYAPVLAALNANRPADAQLENPYAPPRPAGGQPGPGGPLLATPLRTSAAREQEIWAAIAEARAADAQALPGVPRDRDALWQPVIAEAQAAIARDEALTPRMEGLASVAGFAGQVAAWTMDPMVALTLPAGGSGSILRAALVEAGVGAGVEALSLPQRAQLRESLGMELTTEEAILSVVGAGVGAGVLSGALRGVALGGRRLLDAFDRAVPNPTAEQRAAREAVEAEVVARESNPLGSAPAAANEHAERLIGALRSAAEGRAPEMPDRPARPVVSAPAEPPPTITGPDGSALRVQTFDPRALELDPETFQFKGGADSEGVLDTLRGVPRWDPIRGGLVLVWERADGRLFVADGHQRTGLARRLLEDDPNADVALQGYTLREADGISAEMARAVAAAKNIAEGSGSIVDAAKVLRVNPRLMMTLPPRSALLRTARDLLPLSDDAFGLVVNEIVDPRWAAIVGRLIPEDRDLSNAVMALLARMDPENANQAEAIVRQAMAAGYTKEQQLGLFGEETIARSLFAERSRVLDGTIRSLKRDRTLFNQLVAGRETAEAAGNVLATGRNAERAAQDAQAIDTLQRLAHRRGPLSDALSAAARAVADGGSVGKAVDQFREAVRDAVARGDFAGDDLGRSGDAVGAAGEGAPVRDGSGSDGAVEAAERAQDAQFAEPGGASGTGQDAQLTALERDLRARLDAAPAPRAEDGAAAAGATGLAADDTSPVARDIWSAETGQPIELRVFHGSGRTAQADVYNFEAVPHVQGARFWALNRAQAERYGPDVTEAVVRLDNPLVVRSGDDWRALTLDAGWEFPNPSGTPRLQREIEARSMRNLIKERGHDGMVVQADGDKLLERVFGGDQIVDLRSPRIASDVLRGPDGAPTIFYQGMQEAGTLNDPHPDLGAIWFSPNRDVAADFSGGDPGRIKAFTIHASNPFEFTNPEHVQMVHEATGVSAKRLALGDYSAIEDAMLRSEFRSLGFDAVWMIEGNFDESTRTLAVFDPDQAVRADAATPPARSQGNAVPVGEVDPDGGGVVARTMTEREILDEIEADRAFAEQAELCL